MKRRRAMTAVAALAVGGGAGWQWTRGRRDAAQAAGDEAGRSLWSHRFETPEGGWLVMDEQRGKPLLLNFWATWCPPCVDEMPLLDRFHRQAGKPGWQVIGLALDAREPVRRFLASMSVGFPVALGGAAGLQLARSLGNTGGQLPFSVVFDTRRALRDRKLGTVEPADLSRWNDAIA